MTVLMQSMMSHILGFLSKDESVIGSIEKKFHSSHSVAKHTIMVIWARSDDSMYRQWLRAKA